MCELTLQNVLTANFIAFVCVLGLAIFLLAEMLDRAAGPDDED